MKKWAIRGLITLAAVVALCMFFSGTIKTISTAKVKLVTARQGKLEETIKLTGTLTFPDTVEITLDLGADQSLTISKIRTAKGRKVSAGDVLFETEVTGFDKEIKSLQSEYDTAQKELLELERKNSDIRIRKTEETWIAAYDALTAAQETLRDAQTQLTVAATLAGVTLEGGKLPASVTDETLLAAQTAVTEAQTAENTAQERFASANRLGISEEVLTYITQKRELTQKIEDAQEKIAALTVLATKYQQVTAPHDGYIVDIKVAQGDSYDGKSAAIVMTAEKAEVVLRADTSEIERTIDKNTEVTISYGDSKTLTKKVTATGTDADGKTYVDVKLSDKDISNLGGSSLLGKELEMKASYRASASTTLLPASAVRGSGKDRYVYVVEETTNALGERILTVRKQSVTVLAEVGSTVSVEEDLYRQRVAYMEDRAISEGSEVMTYSE